MKSAVETLNPTRVKLTVEVPYDELKPSLDAAYKTIGSQVTVPGFRKGKVPPRIIDQRFGRGAVLEEAVNEALPQLLPAGRRGDQGPPARPARGRRHRGPGPGRGRRPEVHRRGRRAARVHAARRWTAVEVTVDDVEVGDERRRRAAGRPCASGSAPWSASTARPRGDFVSIDLAATHRRRGDRQRQRASRYQVGSGKMLEGMDDVAARPVRRRDDDLHDARWPAATTPARTPLVTLTVQSVKERELPDADDEFAQLASEFDTLDELRDDLRAQAEQIAPLPAGPAGPRRAARRAARGRRDPGARGPGRGRGQAATSRARAGSRTTSTAPRSSEEARKALRRRSSLLDAVVEAGAGLGRPAGADRVPGAPAPSSTAWTRTSSSRPSTRPARCRRWWPRSPAARRWPRCSSGAVVTDASGSPVDLDGAVPAGRSTRRTTRRGRRRPDDAATDDRRAEGTATTGRARPRTTRRRCPASDSRTLDRPVSDPSGRGRSRSARAAGRMRARPDAPTANNGR